MHGELGRQTITTEQRIEAAIVQMCEAHIRCNGVIPSSREVIKTVKGKTETIKRLYSDIRKRYSEFDRQDPFFNEGNRVLVIPDLHAPFMLDGALEFVKSVAERYETDRVIFIGDIIDHHALSRHDSEPDALGSLSEADMAIDALQDWVKAFPVATVTEGNHDLIVLRKAKTIGLGARHLKSLNAMYNLPDTWRFVDGIEVDNVYYTHAPSGGKMGYLNHALNRMQSTVTGHLHSVAGVGYMCNGRENIFGLGVGCLIDEKKYAFAYGRHFPKRPVLGCGVVLDGVPQFVPYSV